MICALEKEREQAYYKAQKKKAQLDKKMFCYKNRQPAFYHQLQKETSTNTSEIKAQAIHRP